jgi:hypothetical protein
MSGDWKIAGSVVKLIEVGVARYIESAGRPDFDYCPAILWTLGGEVRDADGKKLVDVGPEYGLSIIARNDIDAQGFVSIGVPGLGIIGFSPNAEDSDSDRRLIDFDGQTIVVR